MSTLKERLRAIPADTMAPHHWHLCQQVADQLEIIEGDFWVAGYMYGRDEPRHVAEQVYIEWRMQHDVQRQGSTNSTEG